MPRSRRSLGAEVEDRVASYLLDAGLTVITRRRYAKGGELDLVCMDGDLLVFVEVKSRSGLPAEEAFTERKAGRVRAAARAYLADMGLPDRPYRIDLVAVDGEAIRHHRDVELTDRGCDA